MVTIKPVEYAGKIGSSFSNEASVFLPLYFLLTGFRLLHYRNFREAF